MHAFGVRFQRFAEPLRHEEHAISLVFFGFVKEFLEDSVPVWICRMCWVAFKRRVRENCKRLHTEDIFTDL